jgi:hypothetical protein
VAAAHANLTVDRSLVDLRDALAHGRVSAAAPNDDLQLLKFERPVNGRTRVVFSERLTEQWLRQQVGRVAASVRKVATAAGPSVVSAL